MTKDGNHKSEELSIQTMAASLVVLISAFCGALNAALLIEYLGCKGSACGAGMGVFFLSIQSFLLLSIPLGLSLKHLKPKNHGLYITGIIAFFAIISPLMLTLFGPIFHYTARFMSLHI